MDFLRNEKCVFNYFIIVYLFALDVLAMNTVEQVIFNYCIDSAQFLAVSRRFAQFRADSRSFAQIRAVPRVRAVPRIRAE